MGNVGFYSVGKGIRETHRILAVSASLDLVRKLAKSRATREIPLTLESFKLLIRASHVAFCGLQ